MVPEHGNDRSFHKIKLLFESSTQTTSYMIAEIITPIMLTIAPSMKEAPVVSYDWKSQTSVVQQADGSFRPEDVGTTRGTTSFLQGNLIIDDTNSD